MTRTGLLIAFCASLLAAGCATLREPAPQDSQKQLDAIRSANTLSASAKEIRALIDLYYVQVGALRKDIVDGGDNMTRLGIGGGIAAIAHAGIGWFKGLGLGAGVLGVYDTRYKPTQQRQYYLDATAALSCIVQRAGQLQQEESTFEVAGIQALDRTFVAVTMQQATPEQIGSLINIVNSTDDTFQVVQAVHRRLDEKLFSVVTTQGFGTIRDNLVKESVAAQIQADKVKDQPVPQAARASFTTTAKIRMDAANTGPADAAEAARQAAIGKQLVRVLADAATYKTDIQACAANFVK